MSPTEFWSIVIIVGAFLWWFAFIATKQMRVGKNLEREAQAKRNLELLAKQQAEEAASAEKMEPKREES